MIKKLSCHNRQRLINNIKSRFGSVENSIVLMKGSEPTYQFDSDIHNFPKYEMNFTYLFGINEFNIDGYIELDTGKSLFILPDELKNDYYHKILSKEEAQENYGVDDVLFRSNFVEYLQNKEIDTVYIYQGQCFYDENPSHVYDDPEVLELLDEKINELPLYGILNNMRAIKSELEVEMMREICEISSEGHIEMMRKCKPGMNQYELVAIFQETCSQYKIEDQAYNPICCSGRDCSVLHYVQNDQVMQDGELALCDLGSKKYNICSDITTTFPVNGKFTQKQKEIYDIVLQAQVNAIFAIKPMKFYKDISDECFKDILKGLLELGLVKNGDIEELFSKRIHYKFMPHSLGHFIGFKTHDVGLMRNISDDSELRHQPHNYYQSLPVTLTILQPGMVTTVEPGIYFIEGLLNEAKKDDNIKHYFDFEKINQYMSVGGVRIEDDVLVTKNGFDVLTKCPRTTDEIEKCMKGLDWKTKNKQLNKNIEIKKFEQKQKKIQKQ